MSQRAGTGRVTAGVQLLAAAWLVLGLFRTAAAAAAPANLEADVRAHVASLPPSRVKVMLEKALGYLGVRYRWGGDDFAADGGFDCVGLAYSLFHAAGLEFPLARYSTMNMTPWARGKEIPAVWWTEYVTDFQRDMVACSGAPADGDVVIYHALTGGKVSDRTGHAVIVADAAKGYAVSAASGGVKLHSLYDFKKYDNRVETACWRAPSAAKPPLVKPALTWDLDLRGGEGSKEMPYPVRNPLAFTLTVRGEIPAGARFVALGRVNSLLGAVEMKTEELPAPEPGTHLYRITHDFKASDLPVDPGEKIPTPLRKLVLRFVGDGTIVWAERDVYVRLAPYW